MTRVLILEDRFHPHIADDLLAGAVAELAQAGIEHTVITVPGVDELPAALKFIVAAMARQTIDDRYDGFVVLGCAVADPADASGAACAECIRGLHDLALTYDLAIGNGVLTVQSDSQAPGQPDRTTIGGKAARTCLRMIDLKRSVNLIRP
jgi:6,7-dimethyl-8-ribityllumazine synthase